MNSERILDPTIESDWERVAIMEVIEHWRRNARSRGIRKRAKKLTRKLLWLLPESRSGDAVLNPLDGSPVNRPKNPWSFSVVRRECELLDDVCYRIFDQYCPAGRVDGARECIVCLGAGWVPVTSYCDQSSRVCDYCDGQGVTDDPSPITPLPTKRGERGDCFYSCGEVTL